jgi:hypothetical protein
MRVLLWHDSPTIVSTATLQIGLQCWLPSTSHLFRLTRIRGPIPTSFPPGCPASAGAPWTITSVKSPARNLHYVAKTFYLPFLVSSVPLSSPKVLVNPPIPPLTRKWLIQLVIPKQLATPRHSLPSLPEMYTLGTAEKDNLLSLMTSCHGKPHLHHRLKRPGFRAEMFHPGVDIKH